MRKMLSSVALSALCVAGLAGCSSKSIELNESSTITFDSARDGNITRGGGGGGGQVQPGGPMSGKGKQGTAPSGQ